MKPVNLLSVISAYKALPPTLRDDLYATWGIAPKDSELEVLRFLAQQIIGLRKYYLQEIAQMLDDCFFGFKISQISKEFDCLWIGETAIVNIELKSDAIDEKRIHKQLVQNQYYLGHLGQKNLFSFTIVSSASDCFTLNANGDLVNVNIEDMAMALHDIHQMPLYADDIENLFPPERFLVSPFNSTEEFLQRHYFLTQQQLEIKEKVIGMVSDADPKKQFCAITGGPGSGKTLLMYDIVRELMKSGKKVVIGHPGILNEGHNRLINSGWNIKWTKDIISFDYHTSTHSLKETDADVVFIDEAQRCRNIEYVSKAVMNTNCKCVFSFDSDQIMNDDERKGNYSGTVLSLAGGNCFRLTSNIRTNAAVYEFVKALFDKRHSVNKPIKGNVTISYCQNENEVSVILETLKQKDYEVPMFTPKAYGKDEHESWFPSDSPSAHQVIGQEFDNVAGLLSPNMFYNENGVLVSRAKYLYLEDRMLYQILTRARKKIHLVIFNNPPMLERCIILLNANPNP